jgi:hypothetical protein
MDAIRRTNSGPSPVTPAYYPRSAEKFARTIPGDYNLAKIAASGQPYRAAYLVVNNRLYFSNQAHIDIIRKLGEATIESSPPSHYGWFKVLPRSERPKTVFVFDCFSDYNHGRRPEQRWELLSLDEYFAVFYVVLLKSGVTDFSVRLTSGGKRAAGVNEKNWKSESSLLFDNQKIEEEFIRQLAASLTPLP